MTRFEANARPIPYQHNAAVWARCFSDLPGFVFLDSRKQSAEIGRYDIICALPDSLYRITTYHGNVSLWMKAIENDLYDTTPQLNRSRIAVGYLDYDSAAANLEVKRDPLLPAVAGIYSWHILQDHQLKLSWLITDHSLALTTLTEIEARIQSLTASNVTSSDVTSKLAGDTLEFLTPFSLKNEFLPQTTKKEYWASIKRIHEYITDGVCYQINYAHRFSAQCSGDALDAYLKLRDVAPGDFSAFLTLNPDHAILSLSPERFLSIESGRVKTQPIKGTRPRGKTPIEDKELAEALQTSPKDRAENVMIVDLLRNDLGKVCNTNSVTTSELCVLYSFDNVHHLVSMIEGKLRGGVTPGQVLVACSPGGSITGVPKKRVAEIIRELEPSPRGIYCGSVFVLGSDGWLQSSIAIRTLEIIGEEIYCWGGGGIVHDSNADDEYQETLDKVGVFMRTLANQ